LKKRKENSSKENQMGNESSKKHNHNHINEATVSPHSKDIDKILRKDWEKQQDKIKILLLGSGESGKSTIVSFFINI